MSGPKRLSYRNRMGSRHAKDKRENARKAAIIRDLTDQLAAISRDLDRAEAKIRKLEMGAVA